MTTDRTPQPCLHPRANHQHGTYLAYKRDDCRCTDCTAAHRRHGKTVRYRTATGRHSYVPADRARDHTRHLLEVLTLSQIEQRSGVHRTAIRVLIGDWPGRPMSKRIARRTETALLAVTDERVGQEESGLVDATGTRRRLRALVALGWPAKHLGIQLGLSSRTTWELTRPNNPRPQLIRVTTRDAVRRLYDQLSLTVPPPSRATTRARRLAAERRWAPPLAWDDETIDDPRARPSTGYTALRRHGAAFDEIAVEMAMNGHRVPLRAAERAEVVHRLTAIGRSAAEIAPRVGIDQRSVQRIRDEHRTRQGRTTAA